MIMLKEEYKVYEDKMKKSIDSVAADFASVRAGRRMNDFCFCMLPAAQRICLQPKKTAMVVII